MDIYSTTVKGFIDVNTVERLQIVEIQATLTYILLMYDHD